MEDKSEFGACAKRDLMVLDDLSYRVGLGEMVAEGKLQRKRNVFLPLIKAEDWEQVRKELKDELQEEAVKARVVNRVKVECVMA